MMSALDVVKGQILAHMDFHDYYSGEMEQELWPDTRGWARVRCCFHKDASPSASVNTMFGRWKCHAGCGSGSVFDFEAKRHSVPFAEAVRRLAERVGGNMSTDVNTTINGRKSRKGGKSKLKTAVQGGNNDGNIGNIGSNNRGNLNGGNGSRNCNNGNHNNDNGSGGSVGALAAAVQTPSAGKDGSTRNSNFQEEMSYNYTDANGNLLFQAVRGTKDGEKDFKQRRRVGNKYVYNLTGVVRVPYNLPSLIRAAATASDCAAVYLAEGEKAADSLSALGVIATCTPLGANGWNNKKWEYAHYFKGLHVVITPDNDAPGVSYAVAAATDILPVAASVRVLELPGLPPKGDAVEWRAALTSDGLSISQQAAALEALVTTAAVEAAVWLAKQGVPAAPVGQKAGSASGGNAAYVVDSEGNLFRSKEIEGGTIYLPLANFDAIIERQTTEDDGKNKAMCLDISVKCCGHTAHTSIPAKEFEGLKWLHAVGMKASIHPGQGTRDYVRHAIQDRSATRTVCETLYTHTGFRQVEGNPVPVYLCGNGAIGSDGAVATRLPKELDRYALPLELDAEKESAGLRLSLGILVIGKREPLYTLMAVTFLAPLTTSLTPMPNFVTYLYGETGCMKTTLAMLFASFYGDFGSPTNLSGFGDTANALERRGFTLKDTLMVLDDFHPTSDRVQAQKIESTAERVVRSFANRTGRARLNPDASEKGSYNPRAMLIMTGEDTLTVQSTMARLAVLELAKGDIDKAKLTDAQRQRDLLPHAMAAYIRWLQGRFNAEVEQFNAGFIAARARAQDEILNGHSRLPEMVAFLYAGFDTYSRFLTAKGVQTPAEGAMLVDSAWNVFIAMANDQSNRMGDVDPVNSWVDIVSTLLSQDKIGVQDKGASLYLGRGDFVGYRDSEFYYFKPKAIEQAVQMFCQKSSQHFPLKSPTLYKALVRRGMALPGVDRNAVGIRMGGKLVRLLRVYRAVIDGDEV